MKKTAKKTKIKKILKPKKSAVKTPVKSHPERKAAAPATLNVREKEAIRKRLLEQRDELLKLVNDKKNLDLAEPEVGDSADQASQSLDKEMLFELSDNERRMLDQIESALRRIEKNVYGTCESCRKPIAVARLKVIPAARYCIACQNTNESAG